MESHPCNPCHYPNNARFACIILLPTRLLSDSSSLSTVNMSGRCPHQLQYDSNLGVLWALRFLIMPCWVGMHRNTRSTLVLSYFGRVPLVFWGVSGETQISFRSFKQVAWLWGKHHSWQYLSIKDIDLVEQTFLPRFPKVMEKCVFFFFSSVHI